MRSGRWRFVAPPGWPEQPDDWIPPAGWRPDPSWPAAPADHVFWRWSEPRRRKQWWTWLALAPVIGLVALVGFGVVATAIGGNCAFDLSPGDVTTMALVNDSPDPVEFAECTNDTCSDHVRYGGEGSDIVPSGGQDAYWNHEDCGREQVGVLSPGGVLLGCIVLPVSDPPEVTTWRVSRMVACTGPVG